MIIEPACLEDVLFHLAYHTCTRKGRVKRNFLYSETLLCDECSSGWSIETLRKFSERDLADRFFIKIPTPGVSSGTLVWVTDPGSKNRYTSLVKNPPPDAERVWTG